MKAIGIDPGPETSGVVIFDGTRVTWTRDAIPNEDLTTALGRVDGFERCAVIIERVQFYGKIMGPPVFDTLWWGGRFYQQALLAGHTVHRVYWNDVKRQFVEKARVDDDGKRKKITESDVRLGVLQRFGGQKAAVGTKAVPGPLAGVRSHAWSALALAVYWWDRASSVGIVPEMADRAAVQAREFDF